MNVLVVYESRRGHTRRAAEAIADAVRSDGATVVVKSIDAFAADDVATADAMVVGTWVEGLIIFGVKPAGARRWSLPSLAGKRAAVFCTYAFNPRRAVDTLADVVAGAGANVVARHAFHHRDPTSGAADFARELMGSASG